MKYIEKVILENFQSHKNSTIEFDNQLNVIVGPSDSGKTAILRAIRWALYNEPSGDYFIREGESESSVTIIFSDSTRIKRYRSKSKNVYYLYDSNNVETKFEGFGTTVPQEIIDKTGIQKILLDNDQSRAINLSDQLEGAFLLSERGSLRANSIGRLVGVDVIDESLRETLKDIRNLSSDKRHIDNNITELEKELKEYDYLEDLKKRIDKIEQIKTDISEKQNLQVKIKDLCKRLSDIENEKDKIVNYIKQLKNIDEIDSIIKDTSLNIDRYNYLYHQNNKILKIYNDKKTSINIINSLEHINIVEESIDNITIKWNQVIRLKKIKSNLDNNNIESHKFKEIISKSNKLTELQILINEIDKMSRKLEIVEAVYLKKTSVNKSLIVGSLYLEKLNGVDRISGLFNIIDNKIQLLNKLLEIFNKYTFNLNEIKRLNTDLVKLKTSFDKDLNIYKKLLIDQETCPLCFSNIDNNKIENIINRFN